MVDQLTAHEAVKRIEDDDTVLVDGAALAAVPDHLLAALEERFEETGHPRNLTVIGAGGGGAPWRDVPSYNRLAHEGFLDTFVANGLGLTPDLQDMVHDKHLDGYMVPLGFLTQWMRSVGNGSVGLLTRLGIDTYVDPRIEGGKIHDECPDLLELVEVDGKEHIFFPRMDIDYAFLRGTTADTRGNVTHEHETSFFCTPWNAMAATNTGGEVFVQVKRVAQTGTLDPNTVRIPGSYTDVVCEAPEESHLQTGKQVYDASYSGEYHAAIDETYSHLSMGVKKVIARRALMEAAPDMSLNIGAGTPTCILSVAVEEGVFEDLQLSVETGNFGGIPQYGSEFGAATNPETITTKLHMTDYYNGGGLDVAFVGFGEFDEAGNINVSNLEGRLSIGGFVDVTQPTDKVVFCGTLSYEPDVTIDDGTISVHEQGKTKLVDQVNQISFSGKRAFETGQEVMVVTEQATFGFVDGTVTLTELAPGVDEETVRTAADFEFAVADNVRTIPEAFYREKPVGIADYLG